MSALEREEQGRYFSLVVIDHSYVRPNTNNVLQLCLFVLPYLQGIHMVSHRCLVHLCGYELLQLVCDVHRLYSWHLIHPTQVLAATYWYPDNLRLLG